MQTKFQRPINFFAFLILSSVFLFFVQLAQAQNSNTQTPEDPEIKRRKDEAAVREAEAKAKKAEVEAEDAEAKIRQTKADARAQEITNREKELNMLKGTTTTSGDLIENDITAYQAVACACEPIRAKINGKNGQVAALMVYSSQIADTLTEYSALIAHMTNLEEKYEAIFKQVKVLLNDDLDVEKNARLVKENLRLSVAPSDLRTSGSSFILDSVISSAINLLALFKTDVEITGEKVDVGREEFISKVADGLLAPIYYPDRIVVSKPPNDSTLLAKLNSLLTYQAQAKALLKAINTLRDSKIKEAKEPFAKPIADRKKEIEKLEADLEKASASQRPAIEKKLDKKKEELKKLQEAEAKAVEEALKAFDNRYGETVKQLNNLNALVDTIVNQFNPTAEDKKDAPVAVKAKSLASYLRAEMTYKKIDALEKAGSAKKVYWLDLGVSKAGGNMLKKTSPLVDIFTGGDRVKFSGGAVVSFRVFHSDGQMLVSDMIWAYAPYRKSSYVTEFICQDQSGKKKTYPTVVRTKN